VSNLQRDFWRPSVQILIVWIEKSSVSNSRRMFFERIMSYTIIGLKFPKAGLLIHEESSLIKAVEESPKLKINTYFK